MLVNRILCDYSPVLQKMLVSLYKFKIIKLVLRNMWGMFVRMNVEAYSVAGEIGFSWWLVEHYSAYHVNCPDGCVSGEPARGRKDPPYFQMSYGSLDNIPDLVDPLVESPLPVQ